MSLLAERMARHGFADRPCATVAEAAAHTLALQAQDLGQARLGVRARAGGVTEAEVSAAIAERSVVRTWLLRSTIHLVAAGDLRWLVRELGPKIRRANAARWDGLGLSPSVLDRAEQLAPQLLAAGPLTRHEVADGLRAHGLDLGADQAPTHVMVYLASIGLTCHADDGRFALLDDWLPGAATGPRGDDARAELARRYFAAFSPATARDMTAWSGLSSARSIELTRDELTPVEVHGHRGYRLGRPVTAEGAVRLVSGYDNLLVGYRDRSGLVSTQRRGEIYIGGVIRPTVIRDGVIIGRWRLDRAARRVEVMPFVRMTRPLRAALDAEADDLCRFVGCELSLSVDT